MQRIVFIEPIVSYATCNVEEMLSLSHVCRDWGDALFNFCKETWEKTLALMEHPEQFRYFIIYLITRQDSLAEKLFHKEICRSETALPTLFGSYCGIPWRRECLMRFLGRPRARSADKLYEEAHVLWNMVEKRKINDRTFRMLIEALRFQIRLRGYKKDYMKLFLHDCVERCDMELLCLLQIDWPCLHDVKSLYMNTPDGQYIHYFTQAGVSYETLAEDWQQMGYTSYTRCLEYIIREQTKHIMGYKGRIEITGRPPRIYICDECSQ